MLFDAHWAKDVSPRMLQTLGTSMSAVAGAVGSDKIKDQEKNDDRANN